MMAVNVNTDDNNVLVALKKTSDNIVLVSFVNPFVIAITVHSYGSLGMTL